MTYEELVRSFEAGREPPGGFQHAELIRVAWWYLRHETLERALERFKNGLKHFAAVQNASGLYHETITVAFVLLVNERLDGELRAGSWEAFAARNPDLFLWKPSILDRYYNAATLASDRARRTFIWPDSDRIKHASTG